MNREIKFRGQQIGNGEWVYGYLRAFDDGSYHITTKVERNVARHIDGKPFYTLYGVEHEVDPETVGQYTGLKDRNGVKIWEGDVLKAINPNGEEDNLCVVKWDNLCGGYPYEPWDGFGDFEVSTVGWAMTMEFTFEIIGNIHNNPKLLEVLGDET